VRPNVGGVTTETQARAVPRQRGLDQAWEQLTDGLFTYCLSVLCDQDAAVAAVREVRRLAQRHRRRLRRPELLRAWLYALARYSCLRWMDDPAAERTGRHSGGQARLGSLAWPESAGTTPAQREALELTGRHGLRTEELAAVLGLAPEQAGALLAQASCEVERTAAALSVLAADGCPELRRLGSERGPVLGPALRGELVRHLDSCPTCRGTAERAAALGPWPGTLRAPGALSLLRAPAALAPAAEGGGERLLAQLGRRDDPAGEPRFDRRGFPVQRSAPSQRAALLRQRALAGSVLVAVVAAPVVALCLTGHQRHLVQAAPVSSVSVATPEPQPPDDPLPTGGAVGPGRHGASVGPAAPGAPGAGAPGSGASGPGAPGSGGAQPVTGVVTSPVSAARPGSQLSVTAAETAGRTVITLTNTGTAAVDWQISDSTPWLRLSSGAGTLAAGARSTVLVSVNEAATPTGPWMAQLLVRPSGAVVTLHGPGTGGRRTLPPPVSPPPVSSPPTAPPTTPVAPPSAPPSGGPTTPPASPPPSSPTAPPTAPPTSPPASGTPSGSPGAGAPGSASSAPSADSRGRHRRS
jgi:DNA-directed RNA polymerase specialized sigma24 family protein